MDHHTTAKSEDEIRRKQVLRRLYIASALCTSFIIVEVIGGVIANSLAILSDAAHLFSDLASFAVASKLCFGSMILLVLVISLIGCMHVACMLSIPAYSDNDVLTLFPFLLLCPKQYF